MIRDFRRSFGYYFENPPALPAEMVRWWSGQAFEAKVALGALLAVCAIYTLLYVRPIVGAFLAIFFPYSWINSDRMRALFFRGTQSEFELTWKARGQPTNARWRYLFDVIYYTGPILVVLATLAVLFIVFVGYPGYLRLSIP